MRLLWIITIIAAIQVCEARRRLRSGRGSQQKSGRFFSARAPGRYYSESVPGRYYEARIPGGGGSGSASQDPPGGQGFQFPFTPNLNLPFNVQSVNGLPFFFFAQPGSGGLSALLGGCGSNPCPPKMYIKPIPFPGVAPAPPAPPPPPPPPPPVPATPPTPKPPKEGKKPGKGGKGKGKGQPRRNRNYNNYGY